MSRNGHFLWWWDPAKSVTWTEQGVTLFAGPHYVRNFCVFEKKHRLIQSQINLWSRYILIIRPLCRVVAALGIHQPNRIAKLTIYPSIFLWVWAFWLTHRNALLSAAILGVFDLANHPCELQIGRCMHDATVVSRFSRITCYYILIILWLCCPFKSRKSFQKRPQNMVIFDGDWTSIFWKMFQITEV